MRTVCEKNMCSGCMACVAACAKNAIIIKDSLEAYNAVIDLQKCVNCGACERVCQSNRLIESLKKPIEWHQGWAKEHGIREKASSGGAATAIMRAFVKNGGIVCSCVYKDGRFGFEATETEEEVNRFTGSKYIKSDPTGIYTQAKGYLKEGRKVLFVGLPCQVAAIKNYVGAKLGEHLYSIDLICHGTPSPQIMDIFLKQYHTSLKEQTTFKFRDKDMFQVEASGQYIVSKGAADRYSIAFLNSLTYTENCYSCKYARLERVSDLTLGDAWGSELELKERKKGLSLLLVQTDEGREILDNAELHLEPIDLEKAVAANHQLEHPSIKCVNSEDFWAALKAGKRFNSLVFRRFPKHCIRQNIKRVMLELRVIHR